MSDVSLPYASDDPIEIELSNLDYEIGLCANFNPITELELENMTMRKLHESLGMSRFKTHCESEFQKRYADKMKK
jgi:hypothetical protein